MQLEVTFSLPLDIHKALVRLALYIALAIVGITGLVMAIVFLVNLALRVLVEVCTYANHLDILTQVLLILVLGFGLLKVVALVGRSSRALFRK